MPFWLKMILSLLTQFLNPDLLKQFVVYIMDMVKKAVKESQTTVDDEIYAIVEKVLKELFGIK